MPSQLIESYAGTITSMSAEMLIRERAAIQAQIHAVTVEGLPEYADYNKRHHANLAVMLDAVNAEVDKRRVAGPWVEPPVPVSAAFVALAQQVEEIDASPVSVTMVRSPDWDGHGKDIAFGVAVMSARDDEWMVHRGVVRCCEGIIRAVIGGGEYDLDKQTAVHEYNKRMQVALARA